MPNHSTTFFALGWLLGLGLVACAPASKSGGCQKDTDCKGDRICEYGTCASPKKTSPKKISPVGATPALAPAHPVPEPTTTPVVGEVSDKLPRPPTVTDPPKPAEQQTVLRPVAGKKTELKFRPGTSSAKVEGSIVRGETHWVEFVANAEQVLDVTISSLGDNASFGLYIVTPYGYQDRLNEQENVAFVDTESDELKRKPAGVDRERTSFHGPLPFGSKSGKLSVYAIEVGATRGNATYSMTVSITTK